VEVMRIVLRDYARGIYMDVRIELRYFQQSGVPLTEVRISLSAVLRKAVPSAQLLSFKFRPIMPWH